MGRFCIPPQNQHLGSRAAGARSATLIHMIKKSLRVYEGVLYATVFVTGAAVLILEILAVRMLSPFFGTSMFVLSSVLTTILAALALGYYYGGRLADRFTSHTALYTIIATGGLGLLALFIVSQTVFPIAPQILSLTYGPLVLSLFFFFIPAFLLGVDSPFVIKLLTTHTGGEAGTLVGTTFFFSTVGSIVGSLSAGFILIPFVGITATIIGCSLTLSIGAFIAQAILGSTNAPDKDSPVSRTHLATITVLTVVIALLYIGFHKDNVDAGAQHTLYEADGYYAHIRIYEEPFSLLSLPARFLQREVNAESAIFQDSYKHVFSYSKFAELYRPFHATTSTSFLMLGGGAYTIPRILVATDPNITVDVAELEPSLFPLAQEYFDLRDVSRITNHTQDARVFLSTTNKQYDTIFLDAFNSGHYIPAHLTTTEFFKSVHAKLTDNGLLMINYVGARDLPAPALTESLYATIAGVFPNVRAFSFATSTPDTQQNILFVASNNAIDLTDTPLASASLPNLDGSQQPVMSLDVTDAMRDGVGQVIFSDDRTPVEYLVAKQLLAARQNTYR